MYVCAWEDWTADKNNAVDTGWLRSCFSPVCETECFLVNSMFIYSTVSIKVVPNNCTYAKFLAFCVEEDVHEC